MAMAASARWGLVPSLLGLALVAAGAADGHQLVAGGTGADWALLARADVELLGGFWLLSGRWAQAARGAAIAGLAALLVVDLARMAGGDAPRQVLGRVDVATAWVLGRDIMALVAVFGWRVGCGPSPRGKTHPARRVAAALIAAAAGVAVDRTQVGQFPIVVSARSGRTASGLDYLVYLPDGYYRTTRRWPVILVLHGRGECGEDIGIVRRQGLPRRVELRGGLPFVVVAPQSSNWLWDPWTLGTVLDEVLGRFRVDPDRVYLVGASMGGNGTWAMAAAFPDRFAAIAPICGRGDLGQAERLRRVPTWAFHGGEDRVVPLEASERMVAALKAVGGDARLTVYPGVGHDAWTRTFDDPVFYEWLLRHRGAVDSSPGQSRRVWIGTP